MSQWIQTVPRLLDECMAFPKFGLVKKVSGLMVEASGLKAKIGQICWIHSAGKQGIEAEVVGFRDERSILMPVSGTMGIALDDRVEAGAGEFSVQVSEAMLGHVLDPWGISLDEKLCFLEKRKCLTLGGRKLNPIKRRTIDRPLQTGVRAIDACLTLGWGQRIGLFAGAGVGKSSLLGMLSQGSDAEVNVIALIGERSREVREFIENSLPLEARKRSIVVVATSDAPPVLRIRAARLAATVADYFRDQGKRVFFMMDSLTRFMQAHRELGLMLGEPPTSKGYTPSCFSAMARMIERAGTGDDKAGGDITALYTVLVEGDDLSDPVADAARSYLDGHFVLERSLAEKGHYPAIDILKSVSRLFNQLATGEVKQSVKEVRKALSLYARMEDMVDMGAYEAGSNPALDKVLKVYPAIEKFLVQADDELADFEESRIGLLNIARELEGAT